jgi:hypothetical protein
MTVIFADIESSYERNLTAQLTARVSDRTYARRAACPCARYHLLIECGASINSTARLGKRPTDQPAACLRARYCFVRALSGEK